VYEKKKLYLLVYINNITITIEDTKQIKQFDKIFSPRFYIKNLEKISKFLGIRIT
jgi:hypothetical protein